MTDFKVLKQGYLKKKNSKGISGWRERYFVWHSKGLSYYKNEKQFLSDKQPLGYVPYAPNLRAEPGDEGDLSDKCVFQLVLNDADEGRAMAANSSKQQQPAKGGPSIIRKLSAVFSSPAARNPIAPSSPAKKDLSQRRVLVLKAKTAETCGDWVGSVALIKRAQSDYFRRRNNAGGGNGSGAGGPAEKERTRSKERDKDKERDRVRGTLDNVPEGVEASPLNDNKPIHRDDERDDFEDFIELVYAHARNPWDVLEGDDDGGPSSLGPPSLSNHSLSEEVPATVGVGGVGQAPQQVVHAKERTASMITIGSVINSQNHPSRRTGSMIDVSLISAFQQSQLGYSEDSKSNVRNSLSASMSLSHGSMGLGSGQGTLGPVKARPEELTEVFTCVTQIDVDLVAFRKIFLLQFIGFLSPTLLLDRLLAVYARPPSMYPNLQCCFATKFLVVESLHNWVRHYYADFAASPPLPLDSLSISSSPSINNNNNNEKLLSESKNVVVVSPHTSGTLTKGIVSPPGQTNSATSSASAGLSISSASAAAGSASSIALSALSAASTVSGSGTVNRLVRRVYEFSQAPVDLASEGITANALITLAPLSLGSASASSDAASSGTGTGESRKDNSQGNQVGLSSTATTTTTTTQNRPPTGASASNQQQLQPQPQPTAQIRDKDLKAIAHSLEVDKKKLAGLLVESQARYESALGRTERRLKTLASTTLTSHSLLQLLKERGEGRAESLTAVGLAEQLCWVDQINLKSIHPRELVRKEWKRADDRAPNVVRMINSFNRRTYWVATEILNADDNAQRSSLIKLFLRTSREAWQMGNFYTAYSVMTGVSCGAVVRLKKTWVLLSPKAQKLYRDLKAQINTTRNYHSYRVAFRSCINCNKPAIPHLAVLLKDLYALEENPSVMEGSVNWRKLVLQFALINDLLHSQDNEYRVKEDLQLQAVVQSGMDRALEEDKLWKLSYKIEPKK